jgi:DNA invertase Pin-like site-specific DNA recombinase
MKIALYARVSTLDQKTVPMQMGAMREYARKRRWRVAMTIKETASGTANRLGRATIMSAARRREIDLVVVWKLDRWGRSLTDIVTTLEELAHLGVGFVSITETLDFTTPAGKALVGMLSVFAAFERDILRERIRAGIAEARRHGRPHGRPLTVGLRGKEIRELHRQGLSRSAIAQKLGISRTSVRRLIDNS